MSHFCCCYCVTQQCALFVLKFERIFTESLQETFKQSQCVITLNSYLPNYLLLFCYYVKLLLFYYYIKLLSVLIQQEFECLSDVSNVNFEQVSHIFFDVSTVL